MTGEVSLLLHVVYIPHAVDLKSFHSGNTIWCLHISIVCVDSIQCTEHLCIPGCVQAGRILG